jgi:RNA recognition motif-containing protein
MMPRCRVALQTGRSKHFAFIEFEHREVAEVVAQAMNGYLLYSKVLLGTLPSRRPLP